MPKVENYLFGLAVNAVVVLKTEDVILEKYACISHPFI